MKIKQQASGWPSQCDTEEKKRNYLQDYKTHEGIGLDRSKIEKNPGIRSLAKLMLNSFWGKFGQRPNQTQVTTCTKPSEFFHVITDNRQVVYRIEIVNEHMIEVYHTFEEESIPVQTNVKIFIACFTTSYARLKLYDALDTLQERVLYMDTDSVIYTKNPLNLQFLSATISVNSPMNSTKEITSSSSLLPGLRTYAYNTFKGNQCCKVRGFTLNERGQKILNFTSMKNLVLSEILLPEDDDEPCILSLHNPHKIIRKSPAKTIQTVSQNKTYKLVFDKRVINHDSFQSYPYGYKCSSTPRFQP